jgi:hypothetical protein
MVILSAAIVFSPGAFAQKDKKQNKEKQEEKKEKQEKKQTVAGTPRLWQDPGNISERDLYWGNGGESGKPKSPFQFVKENLKGSNPKVDITDANGTKWSVKFEAARKEVNEVHAEVVASRFVWAFGYMTEEEYFVPSGIIQGATDLKRAKNSIGPDGSFKNARFKKRPKGGKEKEILWDWNKNTFAGSKELSGLKILMIMLGNWDTKSVNNAVLEMRNESGQTEDWYFVSDLGTGFGQMGLWPRRRTIWILEDYQKGKLIDKIEGDIVHFQYTGRSKISQIPLEHARWFAGLASQLSPNQIRKAFEAGGATSAEIEGFSSKFTEKIEELQKAAGSQKASVPLPIAEFGFPISDCGLRIADFGFPISD